MGLVTIFLKDGDQDGIEHPIILSETGRHKEGEFQNSQVFCTVDHLTSEEHIVYASVSAVRAGMIADRIIRAAPLESGKYVEKTFENLLVRVTHQAETEPMK